MKIMSEYIKQHFEPGQILTAAQLNHIEDGIEKVLPIIETGEAKQLVTDAEGNLLWEKKVLDYTYEYVKLFNDIELTGEESQSVILSSLVYVEEEAPVKIIINGNEYDSSITSIADGLLYRLTTTIDNLTLQLAFSKDPLKEVSNSVIHNSSHITGTLTIKILFKQYQKIDNNYLPLPAVYGEGFNSISLNNAKDNNIASGKYSVAANCGKSIGDFSFSANLSEASGLYSFAHNFHAKANGMHSHAEGIYTIASGKSQHAEGKYNIEDTEEKYAHIIGNGTANDARSNAYTLDWDGNAWYAGTVEGTAMIIKSPNGTRFQVTVSDDGNLTAAAITE